MQEDPLRSVLQRLGIKVESRNENKVKRRVWLNFSCPVATLSPDHRFKADRTASAGAVADSKGGVSVWSCHACKARGSMMDLAKLLGEKLPKVGIDYEAVCEEIRVCEITGLGTIQVGQNIELIDELGEPLDEAVYDGLYPPAWEVPAARAYLVKRRISQATAERLELGFNPERRRIVFPVRHTNGALYGFSQRTIGDAKPKIRDEDLPKRHLLLGSHLWRPGLPNLVVEGLFAFARQIENGVDEIANVSALLGSEMTNEKAELLALTGEPTYLLVDNDPAGLACLHGKVRKLKDGTEEFDPQTGEVLRDEESGAIWKLRDQVPLFVPRYPDGITDPDDLTFAQVEAMLTGTLQHSTGNFGIKPVVFNFSR